MLNSDQIDTAKACLRGAENGSFSFPAIVEALIAAGFDGYMTDLRAGETRYYDSAGAHITTLHRHAAGPVEARFDARAVRAAVAEAQSGDPGYSYAGFCRKLSAAGCAGYQVSFPGRRVLYFGRSAETHVEHFPPPG